MLVVVETRSIVALLDTRLLGGFFASIVYGVRQTRRRAKDQVFGDPERTTGGWFWAVCGVRRSCWCGFIIHGGRALFSTVPLTSFVGC